jgi:head-tail adaptor
MQIPSAQELKERIRLEAVTGGPFNAVTGVSEHTSYVATCWAKVVQLPSGDLNYESQQERSQTRNYIIWIRHLEGVTGLMQIVWKGRTLVQTSVPQLVTDQQNRRWWMMAAHDIEET